MEYNDYDTNIWSAATWFSRFLHGRGMQATFACKDTGILSHRSVYKIDEHYEIPALKRKLFWQSPLDNFQVNLIRVGLLGFLERMTFQMTLLKPTKLESFSPRQLMNSLSVGRGLMPGIYRGNGLGMLQFGLVHALPASLSQKIDPKTNTVIIHPLKYFMYSFGMNLLTMPLQVAKLNLYNGANNMLKLNLLSIRLIPNHLLYSAKNSLLIGSVAYCFSKDWGLESLAIFPLTLALYLGSIQTNINFRRTMNLSSESLLQITRSNLSRSLFSLIVLVNFTMGYRFFGMTSHERIKSDYINENEARGMMKAYKFRTKHFRRAEYFNKSK